MNKPEIKCVMKHCTNVGPACDGYDFFLCHACADELERLLDLEYRKRMRARLLRHFNN